MNNTNDFSNIVSNIAKHNSSNNGENQQNNNILKTEKKQIPILTIYKDGVLLNYKIGNYKLSKNIVKNMYTLKSIGNILTKHNFELTKKFIASQRFNYILHYLDNSFKIPQYIYFIKFEDGVKIGRTFNIKQRYQPSEIINIVLRVVNVKYIDRCEKELKDKFKDKFDLVKGYEKFNIENNKLNSALKLFDSIASKYKIQNNDIKNQHIFNMPYDTYEIGKGYYVSSLVASIIFNIFSNTEYNDIKYVLNLIDKSSDKFDKENYHSTFIENGDRFFYWSYHNYKIIANGSKGLINASRLWNTVKEENNVKTKTKLSDFLKSAFIKNIFKEHGEAKPIIFTSKNRPLLNGKYLPVCFTHFIIQYLNAKYALEIARYLTESLFEEQNKRSAKAIENETTIAGGNIKNNSDNNNDYNSDNINSEHIDEFNDYEIIPTNMINNLVSEFNKIPHFNTN